MKDHNNQDYKTPTSGAVQTGHIMSESVSPTLSLLILIIHILYLFACYCGSKHVLQYKTKMERFDLHSSALMMLNLTLLSRKFPIFPSIFPLKANKL